MSGPGVFGLHQNVGGSTKVSKTIDDYYSLFDNSTKSTPENEEKRKQNYFQLTTNYYELATDFYEYGWGESFHFAPRHRLESFSQSIARAEMYLAMRLGLKPGMKVLDVGCGVGGPMREIARFSGAHITGLNLSDYQLGRAEKHNKRYGMENYIDLMKGDFMKIPVENNTYDSVYQIEATAHAPSKEGVYGEIYRVLKPGAIFGGYEWCMTDKYDPKNEEHKKVKYGIEIGNSLPEIATTKEVADALRKVGFEILEITDFGIPTPQNPIPWYDPLSSKYTSLSGFRYTELGRWLTGVMVSAMEFVKFAPKGSTKTSRLLQETAYDLVRGGELGVFTPSYFFVARKPL
jgi:sterol 24-C-methyltransferase